MLAPSSGILLLCLIPEAFSAFIPLFKIQRLGCPHLALAHEPEDPGMGLGDFRAVPGLTLLYK
jgi:hypothetical protein